MSDPTSETNLQRYDTGLPWNDPAPFCLSQVRSYQTDNPDTASKQAVLLEGTVDVRDGLTLEQECKMGGCTVRIALSLENGKQVTGTCRAASYCLEDTDRAAVGITDPEKSKAFFDENYPFLETVVSKYQITNFCPTLSCSYLSGINIDGISGNHGECSKTALRLQDLLDFEL